MNLSAHRLIVALFLLPPLYILITLSSSFLFFIVAAAAILRAQYEFYRLYYLQGVPVAIYLGLAGGFLLLCAIYFQFVLPFETMLVLILMMLLLFQLFCFREIRFVLLDTAVLFAGILYVVGFLSHLIALRQSDQGVGLILFLFLVVWGGDAGAYYVGRRLGGPKLCPVISPNKTVSGAAGGLLASLLGGFIAHLLLYPDRLQFSMEQTLLLSPLLGLAAQLGDLVESLLKRSANVKDSSRLIPAHGGILDKLDGVAFAAPLLYYCLILIGDS